MNSQNIKLNLACIVPQSATNGPGTHYTIWVQGCSLGCPGCFNPHTHDPEKGKKKDIASILHHIKQLYKDHKIRGVTITGGEPFQQPQALCELVRGIKQLGSIGIIILTGYEEYELKTNPHYSTVCKYTDVIIAGRFHQGQKIQAGLRGSSNKQYFFLTDFYIRKEFDSIPSIEITPKEDGTLFITGIEPEIVADIFNSEET